MTERLHRAMDEIDKLTPAELKVLRSWLAERPPSQPPPERTVEERRAHWVKHFEELEKEWGDKPPLKENIVLEMRREERY